MSGGYWNYTGFKIQQNLQSVAEDESVRERWPIISKIFSPLSDILYDIEHNMDWDLSGDSRIEEDESFDRAAAGLILTEIMKACPDEWFPKGKWATIQTFQERSKCET